MLVLGDAASPGISSAGTTSVARDFSSCDTPRVTATGSTITYRVPSPAMAPTLRTGQHVEVLLDRDYSPRLGDIVVFHPPAGAEAEWPICGNPQQGAGSSAACSTPTPQRSSRQWIKRIVAGPGDTLAIKDGGVIRNGEPQEEPYRVLPCDKGLDLGLPPDPSCNFPDAIIIPPDHYFVLGDNRGASDDSRFWGPVPRAWIIGRVA
jgi:signal peptidase I